MMLLAILTTLFLPDVQAAKVHSVEGQVWVTRQDKREPLKTGADVWADDRVQTDRNANAILLLAPTVGVKLNPESEVLLKQTGAGFWEPELIRGGILSYVHNPQKKATSVYKLKTRSAVMGVRGTLFFAQDKQAEPLFVCPCIGSVQISSLDGKSKTVVTSKAHDFPKTVAPSNDQMDNRLKPAPVGTDHTDAEAKILITAVTQQKN